MSQIMYIGILAMVLNHLWILCQNFG